LELVGPWLCIKEERKYSQRRKTKYEVRGRNRNQGSVEVAKEGMK
jgi:hypothetical protein